MAPKAQQVDFLLSQVRNSTGSLASGTVTFYAAGTTTLKTIWTDRDEATPAANPYTLDANGTAQLYASGLYKVLIKNAAGTTIYTRDNLYFEFSPSDDIDALQYSPFTFTQATIAAALTAIGTSTKVTLLLRPGTWVISSNADWSAYTNVTFKVVPGAVISHGAFTLNIPNPTTIGLSQMFSGTGTVTISGSQVNELYPEWWTDNKIPGTTSMTATLNSAVATANASGIPKIKLGPRKYAYTGLTIPDGTKDMTIEGTAVEYNAGSTQLWFTPSAGNGLYFEGEADSFTLRNLTLNAHGAESVSACIADSDSTTKVIRALRLENVHVYGWLNSLVVGYSVKVEWDGGWLSGQGKGVAGGVGIVIGHDVNRSNNLFSIKNLQIVNYETAIWNRYGTTTLIENTTMSLAATGLKTDAGVTYISGGYFESSDLAINKGSAAYLYGNWTLTGTTPAGYTLANHRFARNGYQNSRLVAYNQAAQSINGGPTTVTLQQLEESDDNSYAIATNLYTARHQGHYLITAYMSFTATAANQTATVQVFKATPPGALAAIPYNDGLYHSAAAGEMGGSTTRLIWLEAGDTLQLKASTNANMLVSNARLDVVSLGL